MRSILDFVASGNRYVPSRIPFSFAQKHDSGETKTQGKNAGSSWDYGASTIRIDEGFWHEQWDALVGIVGPLVSQMKAVGAEQFEVQFVVQGAEGVVLDVAADHLKFFAALDCSLRMSYGSEKTPNKAPEPTTTAVTIRAPSSTARASRGRGSS